MRNRGLFSVALEDEESTGGEGIDSTTIYGEGIAEAEVATRDAEEDVRRDSEEADRVFDTIDEGIDDTETLAAIGDSLGDSAEKEVGITDIGIAPVIIATEALLRNLGLEQVNILPSLESFGSKNSNVVATRMASVAIEGVVNDAITTIKSMLAKAWEKLGKFIDGLVHLSETIVKVHIAKLRGAVKSISDEQDKKGVKFKSVTTVKAFGEPSNTKVTPALVSGVLGCHVGVGDVFTKLDSISGSFGSKVIDTGSKVNAAAVGEYYTKFMKEDFGPAVSGAISSHKIFIEGTWIVDRGVKEDGGLDFKSSWTGKTPSDEDIEAPTKGEMNEILNKMDVVVKTAAHIRKSFVAMKKDMEAGAKKIEGLKDKDKGVERAVSTAYGKYYRTLGIVSTTLCRLQMLALKRSLEYVGKSVKARKGGSEKPKD
jgi:hypothetical protein